MALNRRSNVARTTDQFECELRKARLAAGLTQEELAFKADISRNYVSLLELREKSPTVQVLLRSSAALNLVGRVARRLEMRIEGSQSTSMPLRCNRSAADTLEWLHQRWAWRPKTSPETE
jgi:transcriptional regulator with XRE-family HTH domain